MKLFNLGATYEREIEGKPVNDIIFNSGLAIVIIALTFVAGIKPVVMAFAQNQRYKTELKYIRDNMVQKITQIDTESTAILTSYDGVVLLFNRIPNEMLVQDFLGELVVTAAKSGFMVQQVKPIATKGDEMPLDVRFSGKLENLPKLVSNIEDNMYRFVSIEEIATQKDAFASSVRMRIVIYKL